MQYHTFQTIQDYFNTNASMFVKREPQTPVKKYFMQFEEKRRFRLKKSKGNIWDQILQQKQISSSPKPWSIPTNVELQEPYLKKKPDINENGSQINNESCRFVSVNNLRIRCLGNQSVQSNPLKELPQNRFTTSYQRFRTSPGLKKLVKSSSQAKLSFNNLLKRNTQTSLISQTISKQSFDDISPW